MHPRITRAVIALTLGAAVAACEAADRPDGSPAEADTALGALGPAEFAPVNQSGVTGTVRVEEDDDELTVTIELVGLEAGVVYATHLHTGRCAAGGPAAATLGRITGGEDGRGRLTTSVAAADVPPGDPVFVQAVGSGGDAVACADVGGNEDPEAPRTDRLDPDSAPDSAIGDGV